MWLNAIKLFFSPPIFPNDEAKTRLTKILHVLVLTLLGILLWSFVALLFIFEEKVISTIISLIILGMLLLINLLARRGHLQVGSFLYILTMWLAATVAIYLGTGSSSPQLGLYIALTVTAGILLGVQWAVALAIINTLVILGVVLLEMNNYPFPFLFPEPPLTRWFNFSIYLFFTITPVYLILTSLSEALARAQQEIEQRTEAEQRLQESEHKFRDMTNNIPGLVFQFRIPHHGSLYFSYLSPRGMAHFDFPGDPSSADWKFWANTHPEDKPQLLASLNQAIATQSNWNDEGRLVNGQGNIIWAQAIASSTLLDSGELVFNGVLLDITERKQLEEKMRQSQKMEALGKLAGGIAHDFNNMLTPILGYTDLGMMKLPEDSKLYANLGEVKKAAQRASRLTRQILAFSRRQMLEMSVINLNVVVEETQQMLKRLIGEDITLQTVLSPDLYRIKADKGQLEQVLVNLVVNARDAMPHGGKLLLETANAFLDETVVDKYTEIQKAGNYVMLAVSDTGHGIDEETRKNIFEPFFTTKEPGKGTGLGLATVLGIIKQHMGCIFVYSEPGKGTTFKIYLPCTEAKEQVGMPKRADPRTFYGSETVLVVEDEPMVRRLVYTMLITYGYHVIKAATPEDGLKLVSDSAETIDLLLTDVIMPGMNGLELYQHILTMRPTIKVLYMSGYTGNMIFQENLLEQGTTLLQKPFTVHSLVQKVRQVLG